MNTNHFTDHFDGEINNPKEPTGYGILLFNTLPHPLTETREVPSELLFT